jgi:hypothetical protein
MDTLPTDVHMLLPVLQCYTLEMLALGYPQHCLLSAFKMFLKHPKIIVCCQPWRDLYRPEVCCDAEKYQADQGCEQYANPLNPHPATGAGVL